MKLVAPHADACPLKVRETPIPLKEWWALATGEIPITRNHQERIGSWDT